MYPPLKTIIEWRTWKSFFLAGVVLSFYVQIAGAEAAFVCDRSAVEAGEWWRLWTGNFAHFGWPHCLADTGLFMLAGWFWGYNFRAWFALASLVLMPPAVTLTVFIFEPSLGQYAGLSGMNVGYLVFFSLAGWQASRRDWFWPALLGIHVLELVLEINQGHLGGAMIPFNRPNIQIATSAHLGGAAFGILMWGALNLLKTRARRPRAATANAAAEKAR